MPFATDDVNRNDVNRKKWKGDVFLFYFLFIVVKSTISKVIMQTITKSTLWKHDIEYELNTTYRKQSYMQYKAIH